MSEKWRMVGIAAVFLVGGGLAWFLLSGSGVEEDLGGTVRDPEFGSREIEVPEFEFDDVGDRDGDSNVVEKRVDGVVSSGDERPVVRTRGSGRISGVITMGLGGELPSDLIVTLHYVPDEVLVDVSGNTLVETVEIPGSGIYSFGDLEFARYVIRAESERVGGYASVTLSGSRPRGVGDIELYATGAISGVVVNGNGEGVSGAHVYLAGSMSEGNYGKAGVGLSRSSQVTAGGDGGFSIGQLQDRVPSALYRLIATAPGYAASLTELIPVNSTAVEIVLDTGSDVSGIVIDALTREGVADTELAFESGYAVGMRIARSDANGGFLLEGMTPGNHVVSVVDDRLIVSAETSSVRVIEGESINDLEIEIEMGAMISGRVFDLDTGARIAGAVMTGRPRGIANALTETATTDSSGHYAFEGLRTGSYEVQYSRINGYSTQRGREERQNVATVTGQHRTGVNFPISAGLHISGIIVDSRNSTIADVRVDGMGVEGSVVDSVRTGADGLFMLSGFDQNSVVMLLSTPRYSSGNSSRIELGSESVTDVRVEMGVSSTISGMVVDAQGSGRSGAWVWARATDGSNVLSLRSGRGGRFTLPGFPAGSYHLSISTGTTQETVSVGVGEHRRGIRLLWDIDAGTFEISGRVVNDLGEPIEGTRLRTDRRNSTEARATSNVDGEYTLAGIREGNHAVKASVFGHRPRNFEYAAGTTNAEIVLERTGGVSGRVLDARTLEPVTEFTMLLLTDHREYRSYMDRDFKSYQSDSGTFTISEVYAGAPDLMFRAPGRAENTIRISGLNAGEMREGVEVLMDAGMILTGHVRGMNREAMPGAFIYLGEVPRGRGEIERQARATTDSKGRYTLNSLGKGDLQISAYARGYLPETAVVHVGGSGTRHDFELGLGGVIEGGVFLDGIGRSGVRVAADIMNSGNVLEGSTHTDSEGFYRVAGLPSGSVAMEASLDTGSGKANQVSIVSVESGMVTDFDFDFVTSRSSVEGYILLDEGLPSSGRVQLIASFGNSMEMRSTSAGSNGHYIFENVPPGPIKIQVRVSNPESSKTVTSELGVDEALRLDVTLGGGITIVCTLTGIPEGYTSLGVLALPADYVAPDSMSQEHIITLMQEIVREPVELGNGLSELRSMDAGDYTLLGLVLLDPESGGEQNFDSAVLVTSKVHVVGDEDVYVTLSFPE